MPGNHQMVRIVIFLPSCRLWGSTGTFCCDKVGKGVIIVFKLVILGGKLWTFICKLFSWPFWQGHMCGWTGKCATSRLLTEPRAKFLPVQMSQNVAGLVAAKFCKRCFLTIRSGPCPAGWICPCLDSYSLNWGPACLAGSLASPRAAPLPWESGLGVSLRVGHRSQDPACSRSGES